MTEYSPQWMKALERAVQLGKATGQKRTVVGVRLKRGWFYFSVVRPDPIGGDE